MACEACEDRFWSSQDIRLVRDTIAQTQTSAPSGAEFPGVKKGCATTLVDHIFEHSQEHERPLTVVGIFGKAVGVDLSARGLLDQLWLRDACAAGAGASDSLEQCLSAGFPGITVAYRDIDNVLFLAFESSASSGKTLFSGEASREAQDHTSFLVRCGEVELTEVLNAASLFNLCHVVLWLSPGGAPRTDAATVRLLGKLHEVQANPQFAQLLAASRPLRGPPTILLVHPELRVPFVQADPATEPPLRQQLETAERTLDGTWRSCLKRYQQVDTKLSGGLFRLPRPCAIAMPGPFPKFRPHDTVELAESTGTHRPNAAGGQDQDPLLSVASAVWPMDRLRSRLAELLALPVTDPTSRGISLRDWLSTARKVREELRRAFEAAGALPDELATIISHCPSNSAGCGDNGKAAAKPYDSADLCDVAVSLRRWAFADLFFSLSTSQKGLEDGHKVYTMGLQKNGGVGTCPLELHEQQLTAAFCALSHNACAPLNALAAEALRSKCEAYYGARRICSGRSINGRVCTLREGHVEDHRSTLRPVVVCFCGRSQTGKHDSFEPPATPEEGLPPTSSCCTGVSFLPFVSLDCDFVALPTVVPLAPRSDLWAPRAGAGAALLPPSLPPSHGFAAFVMAAPVKCDPEQGCRLPGFHDGVFQHFSRWQLPASGSLPGFRSAGAAAARHVYLGFEYQCPQGQRFFLPPPKYSGLVLSSAAVARASRREQRLRRERDRERRIHPEASVGAGAERLGDPPQCEFPGLLDEGEFEAAPLCPYRLFVACVKHTQKDGGVGNKVSSKRAQSSDTKCLAQLLRIWVKTPPADKIGSVIEAMPRVSIVDTHVDEVAAGCSSEVVCGGGKVALPHDSLVQIVLPSKYHRPANETEGTPAFFPHFGEYSRAAADRCRLMPYVLSVRRPRAERGA